MNKVVRAIARERVGQVPATRLIAPKPQKTKPKHKKLVNPDEAE